MNKILKYFLEGLAFMILTPLVMAIMIVLILLMFSSVFQTSIWINELILPRYIGIIFFTIMFIFICIIMGKVSESGDYDALHATDDEPGNITGKTIKERRGI